jgi:hypothetical protein
LGVAGGGNGGGYSVRATSGVNNTGGGGGGPASSYIGGSWQYGAGTNGGSGIVLIRYPSYLAPATSTTGSPEMIIAGAWRVYTFVASGTITF